MSEISIKVVKRPWGEFREFIENTPATVKIIHIKKDGQLSLQEHHKRSEFWRVLSGKVRVTIDERVIEAIPGEEFYVPVEADHRIEALGEDAEILEIALGEFNEDDIKRIEDKYGRA